MLASDSRMRPGPSGRGDVIRFEFEALPLLPGRYFVDLGVGSRISRATLDQVASAGGFEVAAPDVYGEDYEVISLDGSFYLPPSWTRSPGPDTEAST